MYYSTYVNNTIKILFDYVRTVIPPLVGFNPILVDLSSVELKRTTLVLVDARTRIVVGVIREVIGISSISSEAIEGGGAGHENDDNRSKAVPTDENDVSDDDGIAGGGDRGKVGGVCVKVGIDRTKVGVGTS